MTILKKLFTVATCIAMATSGMSATAADGDIVALLLPDNDQPRWESQDAFAFVERMKKIAPGVKVEVLNAKGDSATQQRQAEQALTKGAKVLVVIAIDGDAAAVIADSAKEAGVPTIAYDRMIHSQNTSFWVQADLRASGSSQAYSIVANTQYGDTLVLLKGSPTDPNADTIYQGQMDVLRPLFKSGARKLGSESDTPGWDPAIAQRNMEQALTALNNNVQGVVSSNDGNAGAAVAALEGQGLGGQVPVSGLDATTAALQLILLGKQTQSVWRPLTKMAAVTADVTNALLNGKSVESLADGKSPKNGAGKQVPAAFVEFYSAVGEKGVQYVIDNDPTISKSDVCKGEAAKTAFCKR